MVTKAVKRLSKSKWTASFYDVAYQPEADDFLADVCEKYLNLQLRLD